MASNRPVDRKHDSWKIQAGGATYEIEIRYLNNRRGDEPTFCAVCVPLGLRLEDADLVALRKAVEAEVAIRGGIEWDDLLLIDFNNGKQEKGLRFSFYRHGIRKDGVEVWRSAERRFAATPSFWDTDQHADLEIEHELESGAMEFAGMGASTTSPASNRNAAHYDRARTKVLVPWDASAIALARRIFANFADAGTTIVEIMDGARL